MEVAVMKETIISCITQIITTLITVGVTIYIAYRTYISEKNKADKELKRIQSINCNSSLELFNAYIANLIIFSSPKEINLQLSDLLTCIEKMKITEQYLSELTETDLPDTFIEEFRFYRLKIAFQRIYIEQRLNNLSSDFVPSSLFDDLDTLELITSLKKFVSSYYTEKPSEN